MKIIIYASADGGVCVVKPAPKFRLPDESENAFLGRVIQRSVPDGVSCQIIDEAELPVYDSSNRNRWRIDRGRVVIAPE